MDEYAAIGVRVIVGDAIDHHYRGLDLVTMTLIDPWAIPVLAASVPGPSRLLRCFVVDGSWLYPIRWHHVCRN